MSDWLIILTTVFNFFQLFLKFVIQNFVATRGAFCWSVIIQNKTWFSAVISFIDLMMINIMKLKEYKSWEWCKQRVALKFCSFFKELDRATLMGQMEEAMGQEGGRVQL